jgi:putative hydrolase of HD superfamily
MKAPSDDPVTGSMIRFLHELGLLKRIRRSGWLVAGVEAPESVADHTFRTAALGYLLAKLENADPMKTALMCLFHDMHETRIGDLHRINRRYLNHASAEKRAMKDQLDALPEEISSELLGLLEEFSSGRSREAALARDADVLECLIQAREYQHQGCSSVRQWILNAYSSLKTPWAKRMAEACIQGDPKDWWHKADGKEDESVHHQPSPKA